MTDASLPGFEALPEPGKHGQGKHGRGKLVASVAAVAVLAGGGTATYLAFAAGSSGAGSPKAAVQKVVADLQHSDLIGVLDDLAPGERTALSAPMRSEITSLKRLGVLSATANPSSVKGAHFAAHHLTYADTTVKINDHVQLVKITGGTIDVSGDITKMPFTQRFLKLVKTARGSATQHADLAGHPVRIAAEQVGGRWYASLFYTAADAAAGHAVPSASDRIPAIGASSPEGAVQKMVRALLSGDVRSALALVSPSELGAVHDYGGIIMHAAPHWGPAAASVTTLDLSSTPISDEGFRVGLKKLVLRSDEQQISITIGNGCAKIVARGFDKRVCANDAAGLIGRSLAGTRCTVRVRVLHRRDQLGEHRLLGRAEAQKGQQRALSDLFTGITSRGVDTAKVGGKWFVTPVRTWTDLGATVLSALRGDDLSGWRHFGAEPPTIAPAMAGVPGRAGP